MAYTGVYVFGDSLVDPGNDLAAYNFLKRFPFNVPDGAPTADKGYFEGRFTDGYNYADLVSNKLISQATQATFPYGISTDLIGVPLPSVSKPDGNNLSFAYGGATVGSGGDPAPSLSTQTRIYHDGFTADPNALYMINIGANDVLKLVPTGGTPVTGADAQTALANLASQIAQEVSGLYSNGARHIVVADIPDVSITPAYNGAVDEATRRSLLAQYVQTVDTLLQQDLNALNLPAGTVVDFDLKGYTDAVAANPTAYDVTNTTQPLTAVQPNSPDPTGGGYLFFDKLHPTAQAHAQIASEVLAALNGTAVSWTAAPAIGAQVGGTVPFHGGETFAVSLTAGQTYVIEGLGVSTASGTLSDPLVRILDGAGNIVAQADDGGIGLDSHLQFTAAATGDYTLEVRGVGVTDGTFKLQADEASGAGNMLLDGQLRGSNEAVAGGTGNDTIIALAGSNTLTGGDGGDSITGGSGYDDVNGNKGDDVIIGHSAVGDQLMGGQGNDWIDLTASSGHNLVNGNLGNDLILGGSGGDTLRGGQGADLVIGGAGNDWLSGDLGQNTLTGAGGADTFHAGAGSDLVTDFSLGQGDRVQVDAGVTWTVSQSGSDTLIALSNGGQMTLQGVQSASLQGGWIFAL